MERNSKEKNKIEPNGQVYKLDPITVINPATGQILTCTEKLFYSIYREKGFEVVDRDNADKGVAAGSGGSKRSNGERRRTEPTSEIGSAADIAAGLGLDNKTAGDAGTGVEDDGDEDEGGKDENRTDLTSAVDSKSGQKGGGNIGRGK